MFHWNEKEKSLGTNYKVLPEKFRSCLHHLESSIIKEKKFILKEVSDKFSDIDVDVSGVISGNEGLVNDRARHQSPSSLVVLNIRSIPLGRRFFFVPFL